MTKLPLRFQGGSDSPKFYGVSAADRQPLIAFIKAALEKQGCRVLYEPLPTSAPFRFTFETPQGEHLGVMAYAFYANNKLTKQRPSDEHRFQVKYGSDLSGVHRIWQDPYGLYVTLFLGINPELGIFVAADPVLHDPTRFSVSIEFKDEHAERIRKQGWCAWERERRGGVADSGRKRTQPPQAEHGEPAFEVLVGGTAEHFLRLVRFERESYGEEPGVRHYLADNFAASSLVTAAPELTSAARAMSDERLHALAEEFQLPENKVMDLIAERRMLKMAVRGSVAEEHLINSLHGVSGVSECRRLSDDRGPDVECRFGGRQLTVECKNSSRVRTADGLEKIDLQRTRAAKADACSRYYKPTEFDVVAACVHAVTGKWEFKFAAARSLDPHPKCPGRIANNVKLDDRWTSDPAVALAIAAKWQSE